MALGAHWDDPGLTWDRADLFWDLPATRLLVPYRFAPLDVADLTPQLDANFAALTTAFNALALAGMPTLTVPYAFANVGLQTPTALLDADFQAVGAWITATPIQVSPFPIPYTFRVSAKGTPLARLDANFDALAGWYNAHYGA